LKWMPSLIPFKDTFDGKALLTLFDILHPPHGWTKLKFPVPGLGTGYSCGSFLPRGCSLSLLCHLVARCGISTHRPMTALGKVVSAVECCNELWQKTDPLFKGRPKTSPENDGLGILNQEEALGSWSF
jgi:hypothetical protein